MVWRRKRAHREALGGTLLSERLFAGSANLAEEHAVRYDIVRASSCRTWIPRLRDRSDVPPGCSWCPSLGPGLILSPKPAGATASACFRLRVRCIPWRIIPAAIPST